MLSFTEFGETATTPPLVIAHGLYGSGRNWGVIAKRLSDTRRVITPDMRNHGHSPFESTQSYEDMAHDLAELIRHIGGPVDLCGHSMGGKLTVLTTAADSRVKAAAPSCGGVSDRTHASPLYRATLTDDQSLKRITCPIVFLSPANDFHGRIDDLQTALPEVRSPEWRVTCSAHHSHQDTAEFQVVGLLWFDQHLRGGDVMWPPLLQRMQAAAADFAALGISPPSPLTRQ